MDAGPRPSAVVPPARRASSREQVERATKRSRAFETVSAARHGNSRRPSRWLNGRFTTAGVQPFSLGGHAIIKLDRAVAFAPAWRYARRRMARSFRTHRRRRFMASGPDSAARGPSRVVASADLVIASSPAADVAARCPATEGGRYAACAVVQPARLRPGRLTESCRVCSKRRLAEPRGLLVSLMGRAVSRCGRTVDEDGSRLGPVSTLTSRSDFRSSLAVRYRRPIRIAAPVSAVPQSFRKAPSSGDHGTTATGYPQTPFALRPLTSGRVCHHCRVRRLLVVKGRQTFGRKYGRPTVDHRGDGVVPCGITVTVGWPARNE